MPCYIHTEQRTSDSEEVAWGRPQNSMQTEHSPDDVKSRANEIQWFFFHVTIFTYPLSLFNPLALRGEEQYLLTTVAWMLS